MSDDPNNRSCHSDQPTLCELRLGEPFGSTPEELAAIDEGLAELDQGEVASESEVRAAFATFRGA
jgi:hypothetical protein